MPIASRVVSLYRHSDIDKMETEKSQTASIPVRVGAVKGIVRVPN